MDYHFYVLLAIVTALTFSSGIGASIISMRGGQKLTEPQKRLHDTLINMMTGGAYVLFMLLGAYLGFG